MLNMKKSLVIGMVVLFIGVAFTPSVYANVSKTSFENELVDITIEICGISRTQEYIIQLSEQDAIKLDVLFDDMKFKLDNVNTKQETVEIFKDAVLSLNEFGLLPSDISIKEIQQLVTNANHEVITLNRIIDKTQLGSSDDENFDCFIVGKTSWTTFIKPGWDIFFSNLLPLLILSNGIIAFGEECWDWNGGSGDYHKEPASGWVWTKGSNGVIKWGGDSLWGDLGSHFFEYSFAGIRYEYLFYKGTTGFNGIRILGFTGDRFFGSASHVAIVTEFPGKNPPIDTQKSHIIQYSSLLFYQFLERFPLLERMLNLWF